MRWSRPTRLLICWSFQVPITRRGGAYGERKRFDFFVRHLRGVEPPNWNTPKATSVDRPFDEVTPTWVATEFFEHELRWGLPHVATCGHA